MPTRILVLGGGGREHALAWKLGREPGVNEVLVAPGSAGIAGEPHVRVTPVEPLDPAAVVEVARAHASELVVVGPEAPLAAGVADALRAAGIAVFGPDREAARLETSKAFCHEVAEAAGVRMPRARAFRAGETAAAEAFVRELDAAGAGAVLKADGLAAGKGVIVTEDVAQAIGLLPAFLAGQPGDGPALVIEERLEGREASVIAICDGTRAVALPAGARPQAPVRRRPGPEHRRHGRLLAAAGPRRRRRRARPRDGPPSDPRRDGPPRDPVPRLPLRRSDAHGRWPGPARVQRPAWRPGGAGDPAACRRRPRPVAAGGGSRPVAGRRADPPPRDPRCRRGRSCWRPRATPAIRDAATRSTASTRRRAPAPSCSTPGRSGGPVAGSGRTAAGC